MGATHDVITLAMVEDDPLFRNAVAHAVAATADLRLALEATTLQQGLALLSQDAPQVLLVDLGLPDGSGIDMIRATRDAWPGCSIMVATLFGDEARVLQSIHAGAAGYLLKDASAAHIVSEIRTLHAGGSPISPAIARQLLRYLPATPETGSRDEDSDLSARETQVLSLIARGYAMHEIAAELNVSPWTVQTYIRRLYTKLGVNSRAGAVHEAYRRQWLSPDQ